MQDWKSLSFFLLLQLWNRLFGHHVQVGYQIKVVDYNIKHCSGPPLPKSVGDYVIPRLCRYCYLSRPLTQFIWSVSCTTIYPAPLGLYINVCAIVCCLPLHHHSRPGPYPLYCPTVDLRFLWYCNKGYIPGSKDNPLLYSIVMPKQNKTTLWKW